VKTEPNLLVVPWAVRRMRHCTRIPGDTMASQPVHACGQLIIVGQSHAPFRGRYYLYRMKAENCDIAVAAVSNIFVPIFPTYRMRRVFNELESIAPGERMNCLKVARLPAQVHGDNNFR